MMSNILKSTAYAAAFATAIVGGAYFAFPGPDGTGELWSSVGYLVHGQSPSRAIAYEGTLRNLYALSECDHRVTYPVPAHDNPFDYYVIGLSFAENDALEIAAKSCKPGGSLPPTVLHLAQHASSLARSAAPPEPTMADAERLAKE